MGEFLTQLGKAVMPFSFAAYLLVRWLEHFWGRDRGTSVGAKALWYVLAGWLTFARDVYVETIVGFICFMEAWDGILTYRQSQLEHRVAWGRRGRVPGRINTSS